MSYIEVNWRGAENNALSDCWSNIKLSLCFTWEHKAIWKENFDQQFIWSHLALSFPDTASDYFHFMQDAAKIDPSFQKGLIKTQNMNTHYISS